MSWSLDSVVHAEAPGLVLQQPAVLWTDVVIAVSLATITLGGLIVTVLAFITLRKLNRLSRLFEELADRLPAGIEPLLGKASQVLEDAAEVTATVKESSRDVQQTLTGVNAQIRLAAAATEARIRRFGVVMQAAQEEAESLILDATAGARGLQTTAEALREVSLGRKRRPQAGK